MLSRYTTAVQEIPSPDDQRYVMDGLYAFNHVYAPDDYQRLLILAYGGDGQRAGGLVGETFWDWLHVSVLWLEESARGQGVGSQLLAAAEAEGLRRGVHNAFLDTMDFQARPFYERHGYTVYTTIEDMPPGHTRYFLRKRLAE